MTYEEAMRQPLAITKEGEVVRGVDVYRVLYEAVGFGFVWKLAEIPGIKQAVWITPPMYTHSTGYRTQKASVGWVLVGSPKWPIITD